MSIKGAQKFRPYFTASELQEIITCLKTFPTPARLAISKYLETYSLKISHGVISAAHTLEPTIEQKLGFAESAPTGPGLKGEAAFEKYTSYPASCTPAELAEVLDYRYRNNLMDSSEEYQYEQAQISNR